MLRIVVSLLLLAGSLSSQGAHAQANVCTTDVLYADNERFLGVLDELNRGGGCEALDMIRTGHVTLRWVSHADDYGRFYPATHVIELSPDDAMRYLDYAAVVVHEATHARDYDSGLVDGSPAACYQTEVNAFTREALFWFNAVSPKWRQSPRNQYESRAVLVADDAQHNPDNIVANIHRMYAAECG